MSDLVEFLRARFDDDEEAARGADAKGVTWFAARHHETPLVAVHVIRDDEDETEVAFDVERSEGVHIARWDPARVLAEVAAKRDILELHEESETSENRHGHWEGHGSNEHWVRDEPNECPVDGDEEPCATVLILVQPYADHPDFDPSWLIPPAKETT